jgi:hypothetical protein
MSDPTRHALCLALPLAACIYAGDEEVEADGIAVSGDPQGTTAGSGDDEAESGDDEEDSGAAEASGDSSTSGPPPDAPPFAPGGFYVLGPRFYDADGNPHVFRGVARPSLEWNNMGESLSAQDYELMASWGANVVRLALNQGFWLSSSVAYSPEYAGTVDQQIAWAEAAGLAVILDLHWSDQGNSSTTPAAQRMADQNSIAFWSSVAERYQGDGKVLFELYNEPHDVTWDVWRNGGSSGEGWNAVGMQTLLEAVRNTGADNVVIAGGLDWAYDLSGVPAQELDGYNVAYATHPYDLFGKTPTAWQADWGFLTQTHAVIVTEFGSFDCNATYTSDLIAFAAERDVSWTAWAWYPGGCDFPSLIENWGATPTAAGSAVFAALSGD